MKYKFICPLFRMEIRLYIGDKKKLKIITDDGDCFNAFTSTIMKENNVLDFLLVWIEKFDDYNGMVHESLHLTKRIFGLVGIPFNSDNEEIIAYYQNYWVRKFWNKMSNEIKV